MLHRACRAFIDAPNPWQPVHTVATQLEHTGPGFGLDGTLEAIRAEFQAIATPPPHTLRLHAAPLSRGRSLFTPVTVALAPTVRTVATGRTQRPGALTLFVDLPWRNGSHNSVTTITPCGMVRHQLSLVMTTPDAARLTVRTNAGTPDAAVTTTTITSDSMSPAALPEAP